MMTIALKEERAAHKLNLEQECLGLAKHFTRTEVKDKIDSMKKKSVRSTRLLNSQLQQELNERTEF